jgi:hypothetical protein
MIDLKTIRHTWLPEVGRKPAGSMPAVDPINTIRMLCDEIERLQDDIKQSEKGDLIAANNLLKEAHDTIKWKTKGCANGMLSSSKDFMTWDDLIKNIREYIK